MSAKLSVRRPFDIKTAWKKARIGFAHMDDAQKKQTLVNSGVLTVSGNVTKPYMQVFKDQKKSATVKH